MGSRRRMKAPATNAAKPQLEEEKD